MTNYKKPHFFHLGPAIPVVPISQFTRVPKGLLEQAWWIVGPSAEKNLSQFGLWNTIAAAYLEGLNHGSSLKAAAPQQGGGE